MPDPKSGVPGSVVPPAAPEQTKDAIDAKPGQNASPAGGGNSSSSPDSNTTAPHKKPQTNEDKKKKRSWIEIVLVGEDKNPIPGEKYRITLPDNSVAEGTTDDKGAARVDGFDPGSCKITFPDLDQDAWKPA